MTTEAINATIVSARLTGHIQAMISMASRDRDYSTCIMHLKVLISTYTNNEFNSACNAWLYEWKKELEKYENLRTQGTKK